MSSKTHTRMRTDRKNNNDTFKQHGVYTWAKCSSINLNVEFQMKHTEKKIWNGIFALYHHENALRIIAVEISGEINSSNWLKMHSDG